MSDVMRTPALASGSIGVRASGWWGAIFFVMSEASIFAYLFFAYFYYAVHNEYRPWPPYGPPSLTFPIPETVLIFVAAAAMLFADRRASIAVALPSVLAQLVAVLCGAGFIVLGLVDWADKPFTLSSTAYASIYYVITGIHLTHVVVGVLMGAAVTVWSALGYFGPVRHVHVTITAIYWYFLAASWAALFFALYVTPYLGNG
ncbi:MAG TPA: cytochrome c oxidase subunit 3 [Acetobacteraceae bacterium]